MTTAAPTASTHPKVPEKDAPKAATPVQASPWAFELARVTYNAWQGPRDQRDAVINDLAGQLQALADSHAAANADPPAADEASADTNARTTFKEADESKTAPPTHKK